MAKRFFDTGMFDDTWFCDLSPNSKLFFIYLMTKCDQAGIVEINPRLAEFSTGIKGLAKGIDTVTEEFGNRLVRLRGNYFILSNFVKFQYPKGLNINVKPQKAVIDRLAEFQLDFNSIDTLKEGLKESIHTPQDTDTVQDKDKDTDTEGVKGEIELPHGEEFAEAWAEWVQFRKEIKKTLKPSTIKHQLKKCSEHSESDACFILRLSIENGWQGLFWDRVSQNPLNTSPRQSSGNSAPLYSNQPFQGYE